MFRAILCIGAAKCPFVLVSPADLLWCRGIVSIGSWMAPCRPGWFLQVTPGTGCRLGFVVGLGRCFCRFHLAFHRPLWEGLSKAAGHRQKTAIYNIDAIESLDQRRNRLKRKKDESRSRTERSVFCSECLDAELVVYPLGPRVGLLLAGLSDQPGRVDACDDCHHSHLAAHLFVYTGSPDDVRVRIH